MSVTDTLMFEILGHLPYFTSLFVYIAFVLDLNCVCLKTTPVFYQKEAFRFSLHIQNGRLLRTVLISLSFTSFLIFYPIMIKLVSKCMGFQDRSTQIQSSPTLPFPLRHIVS